MKRHLNNGRAAMGTWFWKYHLPISQGQVPVDMKQDLDIADFFYSQNNHRPKIGLPLKKWILISDASLTSVQFSCSVVSDSLRPHESQHTRPPCPSPTPGVYSNSCPSSWWCHPTISSSVIPFSSYPQSFPASGSFQMSQLSAWGGQSIGVSAFTSLTSSLVSMS